VAILTVCKSLCACFVSCFVLLIRAYLFIAVGGAFALGAVGGMFFHGFKGARNSPRYTCHDSKSKVFTLHESTLFSHSCSFTTAWPSKTHENQVCGANDKLSFEVKSCGLRVFGMCFFPLSGRQIPQNLHCFIAWPGASITNDSPHAYSAASASAPENALLCCNIVWANIARAFF
jgi:hypothetical protein